MNEDAGLRYGLPSRYYLMPEVFEAEMERIFYRSWQFACHLETVRKPGDYATCSVADQDLMVIRDRTGQLRAFYNVCRHRAHQLLEGSGTRGRYAEAEPLYAGRPRTPTQLKVVRGTAQPCRTNKAEPCPAEGEPSRPAHLSTKAKATWRAVVPVLEQMRTLTVAGGLALEDLCEAYAELCTARAVLKNRGARTYSFETKAGETVYRSYPEVAQAADADRRFRSWLASFGLTPADRSRVVAAAPGEQENPFAALESG